jgi:hypothetical protein
VRQRGVPARRTMLVGMRVMRDVSADLGHVGPGPSWTCSSVPCVWGRLLTRQRRRDAAGA